MGEATERQDTNTTGNTELSPADKERLDAIANLLKGK